MSLEINQTLPEFSLEATSETLVTPANFQGKHTVIYFYPKDNTPGCTTEGQDFSTAMPQLEKLNTQVFGVSKDSLRKHENFKAKYEFPFELISDPDEVLCKLFDVIKLKKNYGREYLGIERSTFVISPEGKLIKEWRKVRVKDHINDVVEYLQSL